MEFGLLSCVADAWITCLVARNRRATRRLGGVAWRIENVGELPADGPKRLVDQGDKALGGPWRAPRIGRPPRQRRPIFGELALPPA